MCVLIPSVITARADGALFTRKCSFSLNGDKTTLCNISETLPNFCFPFNLTFELQFISNSKIHHCSGWGAAFLLPISRHPPILSAGAPQPSCIPAHRSSLARAACGKFLPQCLLPSVLENNCMTRYVFPHSWLLFALAVFFFLTGAAWRVAVVHGNGHSRFVKVAGSRRGSHHPLTIIPSPSPPCHHPLSITLVHGAPAGAQWAQEWAKQSPQAVTTADGQPELI